MGKSFLIFDNYDSFTHNLHHLLLCARPQYDYYIFRNGDRRIFDYNWDGIIVSPGPGTPSDTGLLEKLFEDVILPGRTPYLGICLGMQFLAHYYGMEISTVDDCRHGSTSEIMHNGRGIFHNLKNPFRAMRYNSLGLRESAVTLPLETLAFQFELEEKPPLVMALCHNELPLMGVQYHPESFLTEEAFPLIDNFFRIYTDEQP